MANSKSLVQLSGNDHDELRSDLIWSDLMSHIGWQFQL